MDDNNVGKMKPKRDKSKGKPYERQRKAASSSFVSRVKSSVVDLLTPSWLVDMVSSMRGGGTSAAAAGQQDVPPVPGTNSELLSEVPNSGHLTPTTSDRMARVGVSPTVSSAAATRGLGFSTTSDNHNSRPSPTGEDHQGHQRQTYPDLRQHQMGQGHGAVTGGRGAETERHDVERRIGVEAEADDRSGRVILRGTRRGFEVPAAPGIEFDGSVNTREPVSFGGRHGEKRGWDEGEEDVSVQSILNPPHVPANKRRRVVHEAFFGVKLTGASLFQSPKKDVDQERRVTDNDVDKSQLGETFNAAATSFTSFNGNTSLLGTSLHESSFYKGKTAYGGASAYSSPYTSYLASPYTKVKVTPSARKSAHNRSNRGCVSSSAAGSEGRRPATSSVSQKIYESLSRTPLAEARKAPSVQQEVPQYYQSLRATRASAGTAQPPPPFTSLTGTSSVLKDTVTSQSVGPGARVTFHPSVSTDTRIGNSSTAVHLTPGPSRSAPVGGAGGGKMRREKSIHYTRSGSPAGEEEDNDDGTAELELPTVPAIPLNIGFGMGPISLGSDLAVGTAAVPTAASPPSLFSFASPISQISYSTAAVPGAGSPTQSFTFYNPINANTQVSVIPSQVKPATTVSSAVIGLSKPAPTASPAVIGLSTSPPRADPYSRNSRGTPGSSATSKTEESQGGVKSAAVLKTGSVMDLLGTASWGQPAALEPAADSWAHSTASTQPSGFGDMFKKVDGAWSCSVCLVDNAGADSKCVACGTANKKAESDSSALAPTMPAPASSGFGAKFAVASGSWACPVCMLSNKPTDTTCPACNAPKPASVDSDETAAPKPSGFGDMFKKVDGAWSCSVCLVDNAGSDSKCVACGTANASVFTPTEVAWKPAETTLAVKSSFGDMFKKPGGSWTCDGCLVSNKGTDINCVACGTANKKPKSDSSALAPAISGFGTKFAVASGSWACPVCMLSNKPTDTTCPACNAPKPASVDSDETAAPKPSGFGDMFKKVDGAWSCSVCLVDNAGSDINCVACGTANKKAPQSENSMGGFNNGSALSVQPPAVVFGSNPTAEKGVTSSGLFSFGAKLNATDSSQGSSGRTFQFGSTAAPAVATFGSKEGTIPSSSLFKFGSTTSTGSSGNPTFGATITPQSSTAPASNEATKALSLPPFGTDSTVVVPQPSAGLFNFGAPAAVPASGAPSGGNISNQSNTGVRGLKRKPTEESGGEEGVAKLPSSLAKAPSFGNVTEVSGVAAVGSHLFPVGPSSGSNPGFKDSAALSTTTAASFSFGAKNTVESSEAHSFTFGGKKATEPEKAPPLFGSMVGGRPTTAPITTTDPSVGTTGTFLFGQTTPAAAAAAAPTTGGGSTTTGFQFQTASTSVEKPSFNFGSGNPSGVAGRFPSGATSGVVGGFPSGATSGVAGGFPSGATSGVAGGFPSGATSGVVGGFPSGKPSGVAGGFPSGKPSSVAGGFPFSASAGAGTGGTFAFGAGEGKSSSGVTPSFPFGAPKAPTAEVTQASAQGFSFGQSVDSGVGPASNAGVFSFKTTAAPVLPQAQPAGSAFGAGAASIGPAGAFQFGSTTVAQPQPQHEASVGALFQSGRPTNTAPTDPRAAAPSSAIRGRVIRKGVRRIQPK